MRKELEVCKRENCGGEVEGGKRVLHVGANICSNGRQQE